MDPDPDPDPVGPKTRGSGSATLLVSDALVSDVLLGEELLQLVLGSKVTDGLVKNGSGMASLPPELDV